MNNILKIEIDPEYDNVRIDKVLSEYLKDYSRTYIQKLISDGNVTIEDKTIKAGRKVKDGEEVTVSVPEPKELLVEAENIPLNIVYEDNDVLIVNKEKGMVVHPAPGHMNGTLVNALLYHCNGSLSGINGIMRPGIVHRIDKDTTGLLIVCKNDIAHRFIAEQLKEHTITRKYHAIVYNSFKDESGRIEGYIGRDPKDRLKMAVNPTTGKYAITNYRVLKNFGDKYAYVECILETGRTHQIRVHMASIGHPLLGDVVYGNKKDPFNINGQALHAKVSGFIHPTTKEYMEFDSELPEYFTCLLNKLDKMT